MTLTQTEQPSRADLEASTFQRKPAYRYLRASDRLPTTDAARALGSQAPILVKIFNPQGAGTWYVTGYDPETRLATGAVDISDGPEWGDFDMGELVDYRGRFRLPLERDLFWDPAKRLGDLT